jgi:uncharacterized membrane protein
MVKLKHIDNMYENQSTQAWYMKLKSRTKLWTTNRIEWRKTHQEKNMQIVEKVVSNWMNRKEGQEIEIQREIQENQRMNKVLMTHVKQKHVFCLCFFFFFFVFVVIIYSTIHSLFFRLDSLRKTQVNVTTSFCSLSFLSGLSRLCQMVGLCLAVMGPQ